MSDSKDMHINESILSDEIREDLKKNRTNHMEYLPDMEELESDIQQKVIVLVLGFTGWSLFVSYLARKMAEGIMQRQNRKQI